ncbi:MAG: precorrin-6Y C5,15-methyltransferase (decarboxylating) subunit CbiT, partial [Methanobacterium sp.]
QFDILMIGGSGGKLSLIIEKGYKKLNEGGRILVTSILLETSVEAIKKMLELKMIPEVVNISISKGEILDRGTMMLANNPINIITGEK